MAIEIERKFLVNELFGNMVAEGERIVQGYLSSVPERAVRVRIKGAKAFLTIKGISNQEGTSRFEWEQEIPLQEAKQLLEICEPGVIDKIRYCFQAGRHTIEVDRFLGENEGLILAEIELKDVNEPIEKPEWLGTEVTGNVKYYNVYLSKCPFKEW